MQPQFAAYEYVIEMEQEPVRRLKYDKIVIVNIGQKHYFLLGTQISTYSIIQSTEVKYNSTNLRIKSEWICYVIWVLSSTPIKTSKSNFFRILSQKQLFIPKHLFVPKAAIYRNSNDDCH